MKKKVYVSQIALNENLNIYEINGTNKQVYATGISSNGFEITSFDNWSDNTSYEFGYFIIGKL